MALLTVAGVTAVGAVAHAWWWLPESGTSTWNVIEGALSDAAKGAGAALIGVLALYVVGWWTRSAFSRAA